MSIFTNLPYDIVNSIFEMHANHLIIHKNKFKNIHNELISNFTCDQCRCLKNIKLYYSQFCSRSCEFDATIYYDDEDNYDCYDDNEEEDYYEDYCDPEAIYYRKIYTQLCNKR